MNGSHSEWLHQTSTAIYKSSLENLIPNLLLLQSTTQRRCFSYAVPSVASLLRKHCVSPATLFVYTDLPLLTSPYDSVISPIHLPIFYAHFSSRTQSLAGLRGFNFLCMRNFALRASQSECEPNTEQYFCTGVQPRSFGGFSKTVESSAWPAIEPACRALTEAVGSNIENAYCTSSTDTLEKVTDVAIIPSSSSCQMVTRLGKRPCFRKHPLMGLHCDFTSS